MIRKVANWFSGNPIVIASLFLIGLMAAFIPMFASYENLTNVLGQLTYLGIATVGLSFVLIGGGNDLSIGSIISLSSVLAVIVMSRVAASISVPAGIFLALGTGLFVGLVNGLTVAYLRVNPFMMTLITQMLFEGIVLLITEAKTISTVPPTFLQIFNAKVAGIPISVILMFVVFIVGQFVLSKTTYGRKLFATGANRKAAMLVGFRVNLILLSAYLISGVLGGLAGLIMTARLGVGSPSSGSNLIMEIMSAAIIGGNSLFGGKGSVIGAAFGALLLSLISNALTLLGAQYTVSIIVKGMIILFAVIVDVANRQLAEKRLLTS